ncbi:MAG TPA: S49 family peptidase [Dehalococcoidia bacterium]|nr:S49 family peptidase [Dehalococcoidia bacterium]
MSKLASLGTLLARWYFSIPVLAAAGIALGYFVFFNVYPGKPQIGLIDIPFTVINDDSAYIIGSYLEYARDNDDIKAVVIRLNTPGGGAAASEKLYLQTRSVRDKKPVVIVMTDIVASGGYMMSMGASHTFTKGSSLVGSVGVILSFPGPLLPDPPLEDILVTGPSKLSGGDRRDWLVLLDELKQGFAQMVISERGEKLQLTREELMQARLYSGIDAVKLGMVDGLGDDSAGFAKAASLAGIARYDVVDVNIEVARIFVQKSRRVFASVDNGEGVATSALAREAGPRDSAQWQDPAALRRLLLPRAPQTTGEETLPGLPLKAGGPNIYYLYVGPAQ